MNERMGRRQAMRKLLSFFSLGMGAAAAAVVSVPIIGYLLEPLLHPSPNVWRTLGTLESFNIGQTVQVAIDDPSPLAWSGETARTAAWVRRNGQSDFTVFAINCAHLGCPVSWVEGAQLFFCPCHGGVYYADGSVAAGPPPRGLFRYDWRVFNGDVQVKTRNLPIG